MEKLTCQEKVNKSNSSYNDSPIIPWQSLPKPLSSNIIMSRCSLTKLILNDILGFLTATVKLGNCLLFVTCPRFIEAVKLSTRMNTGQSMITVLLPYRVKLLPLAEMIILVMSSGWHSPLQWSGCIMIPISVMMVASVIRLLSFSGITNKALTFIRGCEIRLKVKLSSPRML